MRTLTALLVFSALLVLAPPAAADDVEDLAKTLIQEGDAKARTQAARDLAARDPDALAKALDKVIAAGRESDMEILVNAAVKVKPRHVRLLLVWASTRLGNPALLYVDKVDFDHPQESYRATEAVGYLRAPEAYDLLTTLVREKDEMMAIQAARALARVATKGQAKNVAEITVNVNNSHVRTHLGWALQDAAGSRKTALSMLARYKSKRGTIGFRAEELMALLQDDISPAEKYKVKFDEIRKFFVRKRNKTMRIDAPSEQEKQITKALEQMKQKNPAWHHMVTHSIDKLVVSGKMHRFDFKSGEVNVKFGDLIKWSREELVEYYLIRYAAIMLCAKLGGPTEGHRAWEQGFVESWLYAMDHTKIAVPEDLRAHVKERIAARPW